MKKYFIKICAILLVFSCIFGMCSCGDKEDGNKEYKVAGLHFTLPANLPELKVNYADFCYGNSDVQFFANIFSRQELSEELEISEDITVDDYTYKFIYLWNGYSCPYDYDEQTNVATFGLFYPEDENTDEEREYYYHYITRTEEALYVVIMCCDENVYDTYAPMFLEWVKNMYVE